MKTGSTASPHQSYKKKHLKRSPLNPFRKRTAVGHKRKQPLMEDFGNFLLDDLQLTESEDKDSDSSLENDQENMNKIKSSAHNHHFKGNCISVSRRSKKKGKLFRRDFKQQSCVTRYSN